MGGALDFCLYTIHLKDVSQIWQVMASKVFENVQARQGFSLPDATGGNGVCSGELDHEEESPPPSNVPPKPRPSSRRFLLIGFESESESSRSITSSTSRRSITSFATS